MISIYKTLTAEQINTSAAEAAKQTKDWFAAHPDRTDANVKVWYGKHWTVRRDHIEEDINAAASAAINDKGQ
jgi:hemerythrin